MINDRDFIFDNFELEDEDEIFNFNENVSVEPVVKTTVEPTEETTEERIFPSVNINELSDEQFNKLCSVVSKGLNKIIIDLCTEEDDDIPFW